MKQGGRVHRRARRRSEIVDVVEGAILRIRPLSVNPKNKGPPQFVNLARDQYATGPAARRDEGNLEARLHRISSYETTRPVHPGDRRRSTSVDRGRTDRGRRERYGTFALRAPSRGARFLHVNDDVFVCESEEVATRRCDRKSASLEDHTGADCQDYKWLGQSAWL